MTGDNNAMSARANARDIQRTLLALLASALGAIPLCTLLSDRGWLIDVWLTMLVVVAPALVLRLRRPAGALQIWPGVVLLVPWLTLRFLSDTAWSGFVPTSQTGQRLSVLLAEVRHIANDEVAPVHSTVGIRLALCAVLGLLAALVDLVAVVGRHGALAGVPLLVVYTAAGAVPHRPVSWLLFLAPAVGFLVLLGLDARAERLRWGHHVARSGRSARQSALAVSGQRIAVLALAVAVLIPFATPAGGTNLVSLVFGGHGGGSGAAGSIDPFAALKGQLTRTKPLDLARVKITAASGSKVRPFYLRENVLSVYVPDSGWKAAKDHGPTQPVTSSTTFANTPPLRAASQQRYLAEITALGLRSNPPVFAVPAIGGVHGLDDASWSGTDQLLLGTKLHAGQSFTELVSQPAPSIAELRAADLPANPDASLRRWLALPKIPKAVHVLVDGLIAGQDAPFARARAISDFFLDPASGFGYSLHTTAGDSGSDLVDFLNNRSGFCQQYAAAMAVMLRMAGVPARVVLGYAHAAPDASGEFTVTTADAHAWVEAYFAGVGWVPFDPTPTAGLPEGHAGVLPYATFDPDGGDTGQTATNTPSAQPTVRPHLPQAAEPDGSADSSVAAQSALPGWAIAVLVLAGLLVLALTPGVVRARRRRRRLRAARVGDPDPLWAELADTATDLGYVWSPTRTPRQVVGWLGGPADDGAGSLATLARAVERHRYADGSAATGLGKDLRPELARVTARLRDGRSRRVRIGAALWPASLRRLRPSGWRRAGSDS